MRYEVRSEGQVITSETEQPCPRQTWNGYSMRSLPSWSAWARRHRRRR
jgi:hypothetical protein